MNRFGDGREVADVARAPSLVIVAHGTRDPAGALVAARLTDAVRSRLAEARLELADEVCARSAGARARLADEVCARVAEVRVELADEVRARSASVRVELAGEVCARSAGARARLAGEVGARVAGVRVELAFADVRGPTVAGVLADLAGPAIVLPAFLAAGYHVRVDLPAQLADFPDAVLTPPLGPAKAMVAAVHDRLREAGYRTGDRVVLAAAGSSDPLALADVRRAALRLAARLDTEVHIGYCATARPALPQALAAVRSRGGRVAVASWLLAPGLFHRAATLAGADLVAEPIGVHPLVVDLALTRYLAVIAQGKGAVPRSGSRPIPARFPSTG